MRQPHIVTSPEPLSISCGHCSPRAAAGHVNYQEFWLRIRRMRVDCASIAGTVGWGDELPIKQLQEVRAEGLLNEVPMSFSGFVVCLLFVLYRKLPNQCLTKLPPYLTFSTVIEVKISLILGNLLISGIYSQNPAYRPVRQKFFNWLQIH
jgi:hypothetical protein